MKPFKNLLIYKFDQSIAFDAMQLAEALSGYQLRECLENEVVTYGWLPVFSQGQNLVEVINNALFVRLGMFVKKLPRRAIQVEIERRAKEQNIDLLDRTRYNELEEIITADLIRTTYPEKMTICAYIDLDKGWLVIDAPSEKKASTLTSMLRKSLGSLPIVGYAPQVNLHLIMTHWLKDNSLGDGFTLLDEIEMKELDKEEGGSVRYKGIPLYSKEIEVNLKEGWQVTRLGLGYHDLVTFSLGGDFILKRLKYLDQFHEHLELSDDQNAVAQSNGYLLVVTVRQLVTDLYKECYQ